MILIVAKIEEEDLTKKLVDYEAVYKYANVEANTKFIQVGDQEVSVVVEDEDDYFKICFDLILAFKQEGLKAKLFVSQSNETTKFPIEYLRTLKLYRSNLRFQKKCFSNRGFKINEHYLVRAEHETLDSILYMLSRLCFRHSRNLEIVYDAYYTGLTQKEIASKYNISQVAVSKKLKSNNYDVFKLVVERLY